MQYMIVERFKPDTAKIIYQRLQELGRMMPEGLVYIDSWISTDLTLCFQLMECDDVNLFDEWTSRWDDLMDFEIIPVLSSEESSKKALVSDL